jgi:hypothetical protein
MAWTRIVRSGSPRVRGVDAQYPGLMKADMDLNISPPAEWAQAFSNPSDVPISMSMHPPELSGSTIRIRYPDGQLAAYVANVDARCEAANVYFERHILPGLNAAEAQAQNDRETAQARVAREQLEADKL